MCTSVLNDSPFHADNISRRTYGATLAELTSLEELMRSLMVDGQIHTDVINKLWHVYSKYLRVIHGLPSYSQIVKALSERFLDANDGVLSLSLA